jgi:hypothetical protein
MQWQRRSFLAGVAGVAGFSAGCTALGSGSNSSGGQTTDVAQWNLWEVVVRRWFHSDDLRYFDYDSGELAYLEPTNGAWHMAEVVFNNLHQRERLLPPRDALSMVVGGESYQEIRRLPEIRMSQLRPRPEMPWSAESINDDVDRNTSPNGLKFLYPLFDAPKTDDPLIRWQPSESVSFLITTFDNG